jgi:hypothetical protein
VVSGDRRVQDSEVAVGSVNLYEVDCVVLCQHEWAVDTNAPSTY